MSPHPSQSAGRSRPLWFGTSWKMTKTIAEAYAYVDAVAALPVPSGVRAFLLPGLTALAAVRDRLPGDSELLLGAQNAHWAAEGAVTGEVSMRMVREAGAQLVEVGHSERRAQFGETDQVVAAKVTAALGHDLTPLLCVGEPWSVREGGRAEDFVEAQLRTALSGVARPDMARVLVAYEPVWAIGDTGRAAAPEQLVGVLTRIGDVVDDLTSGTPPRAVLYGGSVTVANAAALLDLDGLDGLFVGRAAWTFAGFTALLDLCAAAARHRAVQPATPTPTPGSTTRDRRSS